MIEWQLPKIVLNIQDWTVEILNSDCKISSTWYG